MTWVPLLLATLLLGSCKAPASPPPEGLVPAELQALPDPLQAVEARVLALEPLIRQGHANRAAGTTLYRLALETDGLLGRKEFQKRPLLAGRLRTQVFFTLPGTGSQEQRLQAARECRRLLAALKKQPQAAAASGNKKTGSRP